MELSFQQIKACVDTHGVRHSARKMTSLLSTLCGGDKKHALPFDTSEASQRASSANGSFVVRRLHGVLRRNVPQASPAISIYINLAPTGASQMNSRPMTSRKHRLIMAISCHPTGGGGSTVDIYK